MNVFVILLAIFFIVPLIEIYLLIEIGSVIGAFPTIFLVVFTAVLGAWLLRIQGFSTLRRVQETVSKGGIPAVELLEGAMLLIAGALLLTPGFFTDAIGFICLVPTFRRRLAKSLLMRMIVPPQFRGGGPGSPPPNNGATQTSRRVINGEFRREDDQ